jgi:tetratricopeptide (TPR) repeat protein
MSSRKKRKDTVGRTAHSSSMPAAEMPRRKSPWPVIAGGVVLAVLLGALAVWQGRAAAVRGHVAEGERLANARQADEAQKEFRAAIAIDPNNARAWQGLGDVALATDQYRDARDDYLKAAGSAPMTAHLAERLAVCSEGIDDSDAALKYAGIALKRDPNDADALKVVVDEHIAKGDADKAVDEMRRFAQLRPSDSPTLLKIAKAFFSQRLYSDAVPIADQVVRLTPDDGRVYFLRGAARMNADPSDADMALVVSDFQQFLKLHPNSYLPHRYLGKAYQKMGQLATAATELEQVVRMHPSLMDAYNDLQTVYQRMGQTAKAADARARFEALDRDRQRSYQLEKTCGSEPGNFDAFMELGGLYYRSGNFKRSGEAFAHASQVRPSDPRPRAELMKVQDALRADEEDARFWQQ